MNNIFSTLFSTVRAKFTMLWTKVRLLLSPTYWRTKGIAVLRSFFSAIFNVKPKNKLDYYTISAWMVSKRLAFALVIGIGVCCLYFILIMKPIYNVSGASKNKANISSYYYDSIPLKFKTGEVKILAKDKHVAYVGNVDKGSCVGFGRLYDQDNLLLYEGDFANSMFNGKGTLYYPNGLPEYEGTFVDNKYEGEGVTYNEDGGMEYEGGFSKGKKGGSGKLYNSVGSPVLAGNFVSDSFVFSEILGKTTAEASQIYTGLTKIFSGQDEYCVEMTEIDAVYSVEDGANKLENETVINEVYVVGNSLMLGGKDISLINDLTTYFGEPKYYGSTWVTLPEAALFNSRTANDQNTIGTVTMELIETFDDVFTVSYYDNNFQAYIYVYEKEGLSYTFYCADGGEAGFQTYSISQQ